MAGLQTGTARRQVTRMAEQFGARVILYGTPKPQQLALVIVTRRAAVLFGGQPRRIREQVIRL